MLEQRRLYKLLICVLVILFLISGCARKPKAFTVIPEPSPTCTPVTCSMDLISGNYTVGIDIREGTYKIEALSGRGTIRLSDYQMYEAIGDVSSDRIYKRYCSNIELPEGEVLTVRGGVVIRIMSDDASGEQLKSRDQTHLCPITLPEGTYIAGLDFDLGVYDVIATDGNGVVRTRHSPQADMYALLGLDDEYYEKEYRNVEFSYGTRIEIEGVTVDLIPSL